MVKLKPVLLIVVGTGIIVISGWAVFPYIENFLFSKTGTELSKESPEQKLTLIINYEEGLSETFKADFKEGMTAFDLLKEKAAERNLAIKVKTYDIGVFIEAIGSSEGGQDNRYWLYYLNGEMPMVSADKQALNPGDKVEFKFEKSSFIELP